MATIGPPRAGGNPMPSPCCPAAAALTVESFALQVEALRRLPDESLPDVFAAIASSVDVAALARAAGLERQGPMTSEAGDLGTLFDARLTIHLASGARMGNLIEGTRFRAVAGRHRDRAGARPRQAGDHVPEQARPPVPLSRRERTVRRGAHWSCRPRPTPSPTPCNFCLPTLANASGWARSAATASACPARSTIIARRTRPRRPLAAASSARTGTIRR